MFVNKDLTTYIALDIFLFILGTMHFNAEKEMATHSSVLAWRFPGRSLVGCSPWGCTESDTTEVT